jgi:hypothetical protein
MAKRDEKCLNHPDRPAVTRCRACHKPLCEECVVATADGKFCSQQCARRSADFRAHAAGAKGKGVVGVVKKIAVAALILIALYIGYRIVVGGDRPTDLLKEGQKKLGEAGKAAKEAGEKARQIAE